MLDKLPLRLVIRISFRKSLPFYRVMHYYHDLFLPTEFAKEQCAPDVPLDSLNLYNKTCYELQLTKGADFVKARQHCQRFSGDLVHTLPDPAFSFLVDHLDRSKASMRTQLLWVGIKKVPGQDVWRWVDGRCMQSRCLVWTFMFLPMRSS